MNPVEFRHAHFFCGLGGGAKGFNRARAVVGNLQAKFRCIGGIDVDAAAIRDFQRLAGVPGTVLDLFNRDQYLAFHGREPGPGWREAGAADIHQAFGHERPHVVFLSAPCLPAGGLVVTETGSRPISSIRAGDRVLTHTGKMRPVTHVGTERFAGQMYGIRLNGTVDQQWFTSEHPMWVRKVVRNAATDRHRQLGEAAFIPAKDVRAGDRIGFPVQKACSGTARLFINRLGDPQQVVKGGKATGPRAKSEHVATLGRIRDLRDDAASNDLWFVLGCYLGDGYRGHGDRYEVSFCVGARNGAVAVRLRAALDALGLPNHLDLDGGERNVRIRVRGMHLHTICGAFGDGADKKAIPPALMALEDELVDALIEGYRATDGSAQARRTMPRGNALQARWKIASVSLQLLRDVQRLLLRRGTFASIHHCWPGGEQVIEGRTIQTKQRWELNVRLDPVKRTVYEFADSVVWVRVREVETKYADERVWNLSVAVDDTFCAPLMATHNCKGFSGLLSQTKSLTAKYQALNELTLRGVWLMLEAYKDDPVEIILFENVPRIATRGRHLLDQIVDLLRAYGYAVAETTHDCGELGGLAQSRKRFLLVARHQEKVPPFLYEPVKRPLRAVGDVLGRMLLPGDLRAGPMHRIPALQWKTWVRLAFVEAGSDWRSLNKLAVENGNLRDYLIVPENRNGGFLGVGKWDESRGTVTGRSLPNNGDFAIADPRQQLYAAGYGVTPWDESTGAVAGESLPSNGRFAVADPRAPAGAGEYQQYGVRRWDETSGALIGVKSPGQGTFSVADPRHAGPAKHSNEFRIVAWDRNSQAVTSAHGTGQAVADPRRPGESFGKYAVTGYDEPAGTVIAGSTTGQGAFAVADPRPGIQREKGDHYLTAGHYGVVPWAAASGAVSASAGHDNGPWSVADPRVCDSVQVGKFSMPAPADKLVCRIQALDGTWHRPFTTLELAALQSLVDPEEKLELDGLSDQAWRERIGNAVPSNAAEAIAGVIGETLLLAMSGVTFQLSAQPIWVRDVAVALSLRQPEERLP